jgi:hypothetical protein
MSSAGSVLGIGALDGLHDLAGVRTDRSGYRWGLASGAEVQREHALLSAADRGADAGRVHGPG